MLMATTEGLTLVTRETKSGSGWFCPSGDGGVQAGLGGAVVWGGGGVGDGDGAGAGST